MSQQDPDVPPLVTSVLHATDFSPASERAFAHALAVALLRGTRLTILHVGGGPDVDWTTYPGVRATLERWDLLAPGSQRSAVRADLGIEVKKVAIGGHFPAFSIHEYLEGDPHDLLVLATEGREGVAHWVRGSVAEKLARASRTMTLFVPADAERQLVSLADGDLTLKSILVPIDRNPNPRAAVEFARRVAEMIGDTVVPIVLLHVGDQDEGPALSTQDGPTWRFERMRRSGDPVEQILEAAEQQKANLIVMPTAGHAGVLDVLRGSTTERVLRRAHCPLLAVPAH